MYGGFGRLTKLISSALVVASFELQKPVPLLKENIWKLENDIFAEIGVLTSMVLSLTL